MKKLALFSLMCLSINYVKGQTAWNSFNQDNYSGSFATSVQPASIVDNRFQWYVGTGLNWSYSNNYIGTNFRYLNFDQQQSAYRNPWFKGYYYQAVEGNILNGFLELTDKDAIGYSWKVKSFTNFDGLSEELTMLDFSKFTDPAVIGTQFSQGRLSYGNMRWAEHSFNYARTIIDDKERVIKVGGALKILNGAKAAYIYTKGGDVTFTDSNQLVFDGMEFKYGISDNNNLDRFNLGLGFDIGATYEYRPDYRVYYYEMDGVKKNPSKHENKYKYKVGASLLNVGAIRFAKDSSTYNFVNGNNATIDYITLFNSASGPLSLLPNQGLNNGVLNGQVLPSMDTAADQNDKFTMFLPTTFNVQGDYRWKERIYFNYSGSLPLWLWADPAKIHDLMTHTVSGRYETQVFSFGIPFTVQRNAQLNFGLYASFRLFRPKHNFSINIFAGANNINNLLGQRRMYNGNVYAGLAIGRLHKMPSDIDGDKISDEKDWCVTDSGGIALKGCPDFDEDGIPDYKDFCPYSYGPKKLNGCPDTDGDGLLDYEDQCPYQKGLRVNKGCPDADKDGIIDTVDRCPYVPGVWENNGCPMEYLTCCMDSDGDGLSDNIDSCVNEPGLPENNGCPTSKIKRPKDNTKYEEPDERSIDEVLDEQKEKIKDKTAQQVVDELATIDYINIYFDVDDSKVTQIYQEKIRGFVDKINQNANALILIMAHTDSDGSIEYNKQLSAKRSEATKKQMLDMGIKENRLVIKNYGESKAAVANDTPENKALNRRVEVRLMKLHP